MARNTKQETTESTESVESVESTMPEARALTVAEEFRQHVNQAIQDTKRRVLTSLLRAYIRELGTDEYYAGSNADSFEYFKAHLYTYKDSVYYLMPDSHEVFLAPIDSLPAESMPMLRVQLVSLRRAALSGVLGLMTTGTIKKGTHSFYCAFDLEAGVTLIPGDVTKSDSVTATNKRWNPDMLTEEQHATVTGASNRWLRRRLDVDENGLRTFGGPSKLNETGLLKEYNAQK